MLWHVMTWTRCWNTAAARPMRPAHIPRKSTSSRSWWHAAQRPAPGVEVSFETERGRDGRAQAAGVLPLHGWPTVDALPAGAVEQRRRNAFVSLKK